MTVRPISLVLGTVLLAGLSCSAFAQSSTGQDSSDRMTHSMQSDGSHDAMFMRKAAAANMAEIQAGRIALDKSATRRSSSWPSASSMTTPRPATS
ncbi:hypothetical protein [Frateuria sp.]|uniref:hypothetical protein n=1 Tax=Frateuria sp. TaxID=2211372 RepID=UPI003F7E20AF